jgi:hypothetical protein
MFRRSRVAVFSALVAAVLTASCGPPIDLKAVLDVVDVSSGWFDAGIVAGQNKLVPSATFRLRKKPDANISSVSLNVGFLFSGTTEHADDVYVQSVPFEGNETKPITVRTQWGYTGEPPQTRAEMLKNSHFRDMEVQIFAKQSSSQWIELKRVPVTRQLLTQ